MDDVTERVIDVVVLIPSGRVMTYGAVARTARTGARTVGRVLHNSSHDIPDVPWWRVVDAGGRPYDGAADDARAHFLEESTPLRAERRGTVVDLARASWNPDDAAPYDG